MKKKYKLRRILITLASLCAVFSMFCIPVSAATSGWGTIETTFDDRMLLESGVDLHRVVDGVVVSGGLEFPISPLYDEFQNPNTNRHITGFRLVMDYMTVAAGDTVTVYPVAGGLGGWTTNIIDSFRFIVVDANGYTDDSNQVSEFTIGASDYFFDFANAGKAQTAWNFTWPQVDIKVQGPSTKAFVVLEANVRAPISNGIISMNNKTVKIGFGNPNSPEAPNYGAPNNDSFSASDQAQDQLLNDTAAGRTEIDFIFNSAKNWFDVGLLPCLLVATKVFDYLLIGLPHFHWLLYISLSLGLCGFIFGLAQHIVGRIGSDHTPSKPSSRTKEEK